MNTIKYKVSLFLLLLIAFLLPNKTFSQENKEESSIRAYIFLLDEGIISTNYTQKLNDLHREYGAKIPFLGVFPNFSSKKSKIDQWVKDYEVSFPVQSDYYKKLARKLGATITPEVVVYDESKEEVLYRGRIDNQYVRVGKRRNVVTKHEFADVLKAILEGREVPIKETKAIGCYINFNDATGKL